MESKARVVVSEKSVMDVEVCSKLAEDAMVWKALPKGRMVRPLNLAIYHSRASILMSGDHVGILMHGMRCTEPIETASANVF